MYFYIMDSAAVIRMFEKHQKSFHPLIISKLPFAAIDLSKSNTAFTCDVFNNHEKFAEYINALRKEHGYGFLYGGYREVREMYNKRNLFDSGNESRSLHLGLDIWGEAGTPINAPLGGMVHSFSFRPENGDYGIVIILQHQLETMNFYSLYGHLSASDIKYLRKGQFISRGEPFARFGTPEENGNWPPHLHFQLIMDIGNMEGDYPGVCKLSEASAYIHNSPDPSFLLNQPK